MARIKFNFYQFYFWFLLIFSTLLLLKTGLPLSYVNILQILFTYLAFAAFFGYAYSKKIFTYEFWKIFLILFFLWEAGCYLFITKSFRDDVIVFLLLYPKYLGIIRYVFVTLEPNENKKTNFLRKSGSIFSKIKIPLIIIHIVATLTIILLMLALALLFSQHQLFLLLVFVLIVSLISFVFLICYKWLGIQNILSLQVILYSLTILVLYAYSSEIFKIVPKG